MLATGLTLTAGRRGSLRLQPKSRARPRPAWAGARSGEARGLLCSPRPGHSPAAPPALAMILVVNSRPRLPPHKAWSHLGAGRASGLQRRRADCFPIEKPWGRRGDSSVSAYRLSLETSYSHRESRKRAPGHGQRGVDCPGKALRGVPARRVEAESSSALW